MKTTIIYISVVGVLFSMLLWVLNQGEKLRAPRVVSGIWEIDEEFSEALKESCTPLYFRNKEKTFLIEQSGIYLTILFNDNARTELNGQIRNGSLVFNKTIPLKSLPENPCEDESILEVSLRQIQGEATAGKLTGVWKFPQCTKCSPIRFSAVRKEGQE